MGSYNISVFVSHSWSYSDHYDKLAEWIFKIKWNSNGTPIVISNNSVPKDDPIHFAPNQATLKAQIYRLIAASDVVVIPTGMYSTHSKWIKKELEGAAQYGIPVLAVNPWGQERKSMVVQKHAHHSVGWSKQSVINGVWKLYRK